jgi:hypothetical protein
MGNIKVRVSRDTPGSGYNVTVTDSPVPVVIRNSSVSFFKRVKIELINCISDSWFCDLQEKSKNLAQIETPLLIQLIGKMLIFAH